MWQQELRDPAIAIPLLGAAGAHAADATTWDRVALCETGGIWSADLGNGSYGGLQFSQATWDRYGGAQYASRPDLASRSQQIAVAEKVYAAEGAKPWLSCAAVSGLTEDDADTAAVDPGVPDTASPTPPDAVADTPSDSDPAPGRSGHRRRLGPRFDLLVRLGDGLRDRLRVEQDGRRPVLGRRISRAYGAPVRLLVGSHGRYRALAEYERGQAPRRRGDRGLARRPGGRRLRPPRLTLREPDSQRRPDG